MIKGHSKIELFNAVTGKREKIVEDDNLVTNALGYLMNIEAAGNQQLDTNVFPIATKALGGIMLFDDTLEEDVENIYFPGSAHLIGYADQASGTSVRRGSYNDLESGPTDDGYVSVWDFGTSQANGTIKAVARTSYSAGANPIYQYLKALTVISNGSLSTDSYWYPLYLKDEYVYLGKHNTDTHEMSLKRVRVPYKKHKVADYLSMTYEAETVASWDTESLYRQTTSGKYTYDHYEYAGTGCYFDGGDGYLYAITNGRYSGNSSGDGEFVYFRVKYSDDSWEREDSVTVTVKGAALCSYDMAYVHYTNGYVYWKSYDSKSVYIINLANPTDVSVVRIIDADSPDCIASLHRRGLENGGTYLTIYHYYDNTYRYENGILYEDGYYFVHDFTGARDDSIPGAMTDFRNLRSDDLAVIGYYDSTRLRIGRIDNYLGTINNLSSAIEKNASQTMKITYTLTDVDPSASSDSEEA